ncbi:unnamed protein product [Didymodactylos carnosus]|uniref:Pentapeptide repeat-containing protein n=1 Tax=Didymodactylos carnosus TaxID=1234261 RepID=A0A8S2SKQ6_9BILA|nr:unnamed protein product [Didymodactylos carnosus]CAF4235205.1 unnamed protein product [Didymodactylos carnosus]
MIGVFTVVTTIQQQQIANRQRDQDKQQADDLQKESIFSKYIDDISKLLLESHNDTVTNRELSYISTKTLTALRKLDYERKKHLFLFLYESGLLSSTNNAHLSLKNGDFNNINFNIDSNGKILASNFYRLKLTNAYLINTSFTDCNLDKSDFSYSVMNQVSLTISTLRDSTFIHTSLEHANFYKTFFRKTNFNSARLRSADFTGAEVYAVDFTNADLEKALITDEQLKTSITSGTRLPNGTFGSFQAKNLVKNGDAEIKDCKNDNRVYNWDDIYGEVRTVMYNSSNASIVNQQGDCYFSGRNGSSISQMIQISDYTLLIDNNKTKYNVSLYIRNNVFLQLLFMTKDQTSTVVTVDTVWQSPTKLVYATKAGIVPKYTRQMVISKRKPALKGLKDGWGEAQFKFWVRKHFKLVTIGELQVVYGIK